MKKVIIVNSLLILSLALCLLTSNPSQATTYYVDRNHSSANNTNPGTLDLPWLTIQHAAKTVVAGDTVFIRTGVYNEHVYIENEGNVTDGYIVFSAYPGEAPVIDGTGVTDANNGVIVDKAYIKLLGLEIRNWNENGIWVENAAFLEISDCVVHDVFYGIGLADGTHDFELNRVVMHHFDLYGFDASPSGGADCNNGTFNDCIAHTGRDPGQNVDGFALGHGNQHDFTFNRCETYNVYDGFDVGENEGGSTNVVFSRCSAHNCWNDGFKLTGQGMLVNCLSYHNSNANVGLYWGYAVGKSTLHSSTFMDTESYNVWVENSVDSLYMYNCILAGGDNIGLAFEQRDASTYKGDYNLFHNDNADRAIAVGYEDEFSLTQIESGTWTTYSGQDAHSLVAYSDTSLFVNPTNFDLHLLQTSPAVDNGTSDSAPSEDYDGNPRPSGNGYDIGAYEYQSSIDVHDNDRKSGVPETMILFQNYPNPFNAKTVIGYSLSDAGFVELAIYNFSGQRVRTLLSENQSAGSYQIDWDARDDSGIELASGVYFCRLRAESYKQTRKLLLLK